MLKKLLKEAKIEQKDLYEITGIKSQSTLSLKLNGKARFYVDEIWAIRDLIYEKTGKFYLIEELFKDE